MQKIAVRCALLLVATSIALAFQNCAKGLVTIEDASQLNVLRHDEAHIMQASAKSEANSDIEFVVHDESLSATATLRWSHSLDDVSQACAEKSSNAASSYVVNCGSAGKLKLLVEMTDQGKTQSLNYQAVLTSGPGPTPNTLLVTFSIPPGTGTSAWNTTATIVETFVGQTLRIMNTDTVNHQLHTNGRPCAHGNLILPGQSGDCVISQSYSKAANGALYEHLVGPTAEFHMIAYDGAQLYAQNCATCHGSDISASAKRGKSSLEIRNAMSSVAQMSARPGLIALTPIQIEAIAHALK